MITKEGCGPLWQAPVFEPLSLALLPGSPGFFSEGHLWPWWILLKGEDGDAGERLSGGK